MAYMRYPGMKVALASILLGISGLALGIPSESMNSSVWSQWRGLDDGGGMNGGAFSSPVLRAPGGVSQLVVQARNVLAGLDLQNGAVLWRQPVKAFRGMNILTPLVFDDSVFTSSYGGGSRLYDVKRSGDGLALAEVFLE